MADQSVGATAPLGVGQIVSECFSLLFSRIGVFFLLTFIPTLISIAISTGYFGTGMYTGEVDPAELMSAFSSPLSIVVLVVVPMVIYGLSTALIVCAAYDAKLGRPARIGQYFTIALARVVPVSLVSLVVGIIVGIGFMLLLVPGLYLAALFSVAIVVVVLESMWFGALGRSIQLTKGYRWPILGALILLYLVVIGINLVLGLFSVALFSTSPILGIIVYSAFGAIGSALLSIGFVLIYARLREIKEGVSVDAIAEVFS